MSLIFSQTLTYAKACGTLVKTLRLFGFSTLGQVVDALVVETLTTDLAMSRLWREQLHCQCVGDVRRLTRRSFEALPGLGQYHWERTNEILLAHGLPEIEDDPISALKIRKLERRV